MGYSVERTALLARLDSPAPLVVLEALPGAGKLTALRQWAAAEPGRVLVEGRRLVYTGADLAAQTLEAIRAAGRRAGQPTPPALAAHLTGPPTQTNEEIAQRFVAVLAQTPWLTQVAFDGLDHTAAEPFIAGLQVVRAARPDLRVIYSTVDATALVAAGAAAGLATEVIVDSEVWFRHGETERLARGVLPELSPEAVSALHRATWGRPSLLRAMLTTRPDRVRSGDVTEAEVAQLWDAWPLVGDDLGEAALPELVRQLSPAPRFGLELAQHATGDADVARLLERAVATGLLEAAPGTRPGGTAYRWRHGLGRRFDTLVREVQDPPQDQERRERLLDSALATRDVPLAVVLLVQLRRLAEAETLAQAGLWELVVSGDTELWRALLHAPREWLSTYPSLALLAATLEREASAAGDGRAPLAAVQARTHRTDLVVAPDALAPALAQLAFFALGAGDYETAAAAARQWLDRLNALLGTGAGAGAGAAAGTDTGTGTGAGAGTGAAVAGGAAGAGGASPAGPALLSEGLLVLGALAQLGRTREARALVRPLLAMAQVDRSSDPSGDRRVDLLRIRTALAVLAGDPYDALAGDAMDAVPATSRRDLDWAMRGWTKALVALDSGDATAALAHASDALARVARPERWPALLRVRALAARACGANDGPPGDPGGRDAGGGPEGAEARAVAVADAVVEAVVGAADGAGSADGSADGAADGAAAPTPRELDALRLSRAVRALDRGDEPAAREALAEIAAQRTTDLGAPSLAPLGLLGTPTAQLEELLALAREVLPPREVARLERARGFAPPRRGPAEEVRLTEREATILRHLRAGEGNAAIAAALFVTVNTVKFHRANLYRKLRARSVREVLARADELGLGA